MHFLCKNADDCGLSAVENAVFDLKEIILALKTTANFLSSSDIELSFVSYSVQLKLHVVAAGTKGFLNPNLEV